MATELRLLSGNSQATPINTAFPSRLRVLALRDGISVPNVLLRFGNAQSGASANFQSTGTYSYEAYTDVNGYCDSDIFIANGTLGSWGGAVSSVATFEWYAQYSAQNVSSPPGLQTLALIGGTNQKAEVGKQYGPLSAKCTDQYGAPMRNVSVRFDNQQYEAYGSFAGGNTVYVYTDANGVAVSPIFTASAQVGQFWVMASVMPKNEQTPWQNIPAQPPQIHTLIYCEA